MDTGEEEGTETVVVEPVKQPVKLPKPKPKPEPEPLKVPARTSTQRASASRRHAAGVTDELTVPNPFQEG